MNNPGSNGRGDVVRRRRMRIERPSASRCPIVGLSEDAQGMCGESNAPTAQHPIEPQLVRARQKIQCTQCDIDDKIDHQVVIKPFAHLTPIRRYIVVDCGHSTPHSDLDRLSWGRSRRFGGQILIRRSAQSSETLIRRFVRFWVPSSRP